jgi:membrane protein DedA with SNARE-associated domain
VIPAHLSVPAVLVALLLGGAGAPFPEELGLVTLGYLSWRGEAPLVLVLPLAFAVVVAGDVSLYLIGRLGRRLPVVAQILHSARAERMRQHLPRLLFFGRFLIGVRAVFFLAAGAAEVPLARFLACDLVAALLSVLFLTGLGLYFAPVIDQIWPALLRFELILLALAPLAILLTWRRRLKPR